MTNILIADDHPLFRDALRMIVLDAEPDAHIQEVCDMDGATAYTLKNPETDLILLDLTMPGSAGFSGLVNLRSAVPEIPIVVISANDDPTIVSRALTCGASGFISKSASRHTILTGVRQVLAGEIYVSGNTHDLIPTGTNHDKKINGELLQSLSAAELRVLDLLNRGKLNKVIAYELEITESTVKAHISAIFKKLGVQNRTQAVLLAKTLDSSFL